MCVAGRREGRQAAHESAESLLVHTVEAATGLPTELYTYQASWKPLDAPRSQGARSYVRNGGDSLFNGNNEEQGATLLP